MLFESLFLCENVAQTCSDIDGYSVTTNDIDSDMFNEYLNKGLYPLSRKPSTDMQVDLCDFKEFTHHEKNENKETDYNTRDESTKTSKTSFPSTLTTTTMTAHTTSPFLKKRPPGSFDIFDTDQGSTSQMDLSQSTNTDEKHFLALLIGDELSNAKLAKLAIKIIDRSSCISFQEWNGLNKNEQLTLAIYLENIYDLNVNCRYGDDALMQLNRLMQIPGKGKRNEEKWKKTVKNVNKLMTRTFVHLNGLHQLTAGELEVAFYNAYFDRSEGQDKIIDTLGCSQDFSQKVFKQIIRNQRYAEDFEAVLSNTYIVEFVRSRQETICKSMGMIKKKLFSISDKEQESTLACKKLIKRAPWDIAEVIDGARLCKSLISKSR